MERRAGSGLGQSQRLRGLGRAPGDEATTSNAVVVFVSAFFSLLILSFAFAVLAGRSGDGEELAIATFEQLLLGGMFGLSTLLLLLGLQAVLRSYGANRLVFAPARQLIRVMTAILGPVLVLALQFSSALDLTRYRLEADTSALARCDVAGFPASVSVDLAIVAAATIGIVLLAVLRERLPSDRSATPTAAKLVLGMTVVIVITASVLVPLLPLETLTSPLLERGALSVAAAGATAVAWGSRHNASGMKALEPTSYGIRCSPWAPGPPGALGRSHRARRRS